MTQNMHPLLAECHDDFRHMSQSMTDDACHIVAAFSQAPVMTQRAVATLTGLSHHAVGFILTQMALCGIVMVSDNHWRMTGRFREYLSGTGSRMSHVKTTQNTASGGKFR